MRLCDLLHILRLYYIVILSFNMFHVVEEYMAWVHE